MTWKPIRARLNPMQEVVIGSPEEALQFIDSNRNMATSDLFRRAQKHCAAAKMDPSFGATAELAFRAALSIWGMLPEARKRSVAGH